MTPEEVVDSFVIGLWGFLFFWVFGVGGALLRLEWWRIKLIASRVKRASVDLMLLGPFLIPMGVWLLVVLLGGR